MINYSIYIVDDEKTTTDSVTMALEDDYQIKAFSDAETAIAQLEEDPPDLILLEIGLPGMNGIDALRHIKDLYPDILVIMITAYEDIDTRVISATNKDLDQMIADGQFRKDLYFRLGVIKVKAPSLNERPDDIIPLTKYFLQEFSCKFGKKFTGISSDAETILITHNWTGHVRELKNLIEKAVLTGKGPELSPRDLGLDPKSQHNQKARFSAKTGFTPLPPEGIILDAQLQSLEKHYIEEALKMAKGN